MQPLLFLTHRIPFPPNKGDKLRSYHLLRFLAQRYRVYLGTFIDDAVDEQYLPQARALCADVHAVRLQPRRARLRSLSGLFSGEALSLPYYRDAGLARWVERCLREQHIERALVFSSPVAQYLPADRALTQVIDFVDVDSAKWTEYAQTRPWPLSWIYRREGEKLLDFERKIAARSDVSLFVTEAEVALFKQLAPECASRIRVLANGVDSELFAPDPALASPYSEAEAPIVFTGMMDYWPNIDAVTWFVSDIWPDIKAQWPQARFYIVGMHPTAAVQALAQSDGVVVTGRVPDVQPYLQHARVVVAPLRVARGIQNKVLEAMAMQKAVVVAQAPAAGLGGTPGVHYRVANDAAGFAQQVLDMRDATTAQAMGLAAREHVLQHYQWAKNLAPIEGWLRQSHTREATAAPDLAAVS